MSYCRSNTFTQLFAPLFIIQMLSTINKPWQRMCITSYNYSIYYAWYILQDTLQQLRTCLHIHFNIKTTTTTSTDCSTGGDEERGLNSSSVCDAHHTELMRWMSKHQTTLRPHRYRRTPSHLIVFDSEASLGPNAWDPITTNSSLGCLITSKAWSLAQREVKKSTYDLFESIYEPLKGFLKEYFIYLSLKLTCRVTAWTGHWFETSVHTANLALSAFGRCLIAYENCQSRNNRLITS